MNKTNHTVLYYFPTHYVQRGDFFDPFYVHVLSYDALGPPTQVTGRQTSRYSDSTG